MHRKTTSVRQAPKSRAPSRSAWRRSSSPILRTTGGAISRASQAPSMVLAAEPMACPVSLSRSQPHSMGFLTWCCTAMVASFRCWKVAAQVWRPVVAYISPSRRPPRAAIRHAAESTPITSGRKPLTELAERPQGQPGGKAAGDTQGAGHACDLEAGQQRSRSRWAVDQSGVDEDQTNRHGADHEATGHRGKRVRPAATPEIERGRQAEDQGMADCNRQAEDQGRKAETPDRAGGER